MLQLIAKTEIRDDRLWVRDLYHDSAQVRLLQAEGVQDGSVVHCGVQGQQTVLLEVLAEPGSGLAALYEIAAEEGLSPLFSPDTEREVQGCLRNPGIDAADLTDLTAAAFCTIDGAGTRDLDQAVYIEQQGDGYRVDYALADAAWYVQPGSALFAQALQRGASFYLPGLSIPMLPRALSEGLISLNPREERRALVFRMHLDTQGQCTKTQLVRARIRSRARLSFEQVQTYLDDGALDVLGPGADAALGHSLRCLRSVGELRLQDARERELVRYRRSEVNTDLGPAGIRFVIYDEIRSPVEKYNEQLSLLCNVEGAHFLRDGAREQDFIDPIYKIHPFPEEARIRAFERTVAQLVRAHELDRNLWGYRHGGERSLAQYLEALPERGPQARIARAIHRQAVMINLRSSFSTEAGPHYGVGAEVYARFTAPMRELVGIYLHREALERMQGRKTPGVEREPGLLQQIVESANRAKSIQSRITKHSNLRVLDQLFGDDLQQPPQGRPERLATVMGVSARKLYVLLDRPEVEVKVYVDDLRSEADESLQCCAEDTELSTVGKQETCARLGDAVALTVRGRSEQGRWQFTLRRLS